MSIYQPKNLIVKLILPIGLLLVIYKDTLLWLLENFRANDSYYSHGYLIPFIVLFLIWKKRKSLAQVKITGTKGGMAVLVLGLCFYLAGFITKVYLITEFSLLPVLGGLVWYLFGYRKIRMILPELFFLIFMLPIPTFLLNNIAFPLRLFATQATVGIMKLIGLPAIQRGTEIVFPGASLLVDTPCSGLRSIISFLALGYLFSYFLNNSMLKKAILFITTVPIALFTNIIRILMLSIIAFFCGASVATNKVIHETSGIFVFVVGFGILMLLKKYCEN